MNRGVWIRPLRDWNFGLEGVAWYSKPSLNQTFEGLKLFQLDLLVNWGYVFESDLWGIEIKIIAIFNLFIAQFESDLWGIEINATRGDIRRLEDSLNQTFEGLKWLSCSPHSSTWSCLNQTFEGLKFDHYGIRLGPRSCLNQTFEGLKLYAPRKGE